MERITQNMGKNRFYIREELAFNQDINGFTGEAVNKLAAFENLYEDLLNKQTQIPLQLEKLRSEDKTKTVRFRELMVEKMMNDSIISLFKLHGI